MARFRPSRLFRRFSAQPTADDDHSYPSPTTTTATLRSNLLSHPAPPPLPPSPDRPTTSDPHLPRKSRSLTKLRKRFVLHHHNHDKPSRPAHHRRESAFGVLEASQTGKVAPGEEEANRSRSEAVPSYVLPPSLVELDGQTPGASVVDLHLETDGLVKAPELVVSQPTPVAFEAGSEGVIGLDQLDRPLSGEITLAANSEDCSASEGGHHHETPDSSETNAEKHPPSAVQPSTSQPTEHPDQPRLTRRPSIVDSANAQVVDALIDAPPRPANGPPGTAVDSFPARLPEISAMMQRKIWVKRPGASPTMVQIKEDDLVDDVRDAILRKYGNSLGKTFDSPDMTINIVTRQENGGPPRSERVLGPEEEMCRTLDSYYPGGQTVDEALVINVPQKRSTPRPSPQAHYSQAYHTMDDLRPMENGTGYFPPMSTFVPASIPQTAGSHDSRSSHSHHHHSVAAPTEHPPRSISVLNTGQVPLLPSPGAQARRHGHRPKMPRQPTSSPTIITHSSAAPMTLNPPMLNQLPNLVHRHTTRPRMDSSASDTHHNIPAAPPLPTPPAPEAPPTNLNSSTPPPPTPAVGAAGAATTSHRPSRPKKGGRKSTPDKPSSKTRGSHPLADLSTATTLSPSNPAATLLDTSVPPINVLIVEDNIINLRILEGLMKRLKVRWQTAMNGQIAVDKWRLGGFHLVLMDIQMPVMSGLQATKEIRRLERINGIGVFSSSAPATPGGSGEGKEDSTSKPTDSTSKELANGETPAEGSEAEEKKTDPADDRLIQGDGLFKSPVIIVALTASSLQSDRHEALAAGCNDFLTKPVNFVWLERKVKEWGCMQALIDFDGWRRWKEFAANGSGSAASAAAASGTGNGAGGGAKGKGGKMAGAGAAAAAAAAGTGAKKSLEGKKPAPAAKKAEEAETEKNGQSSAAAPAAPAVAAPATEMEKMNAAAAKGVDGLGTDADAASGAGAGADADAGSAAAAASS